MSHAREAKVNGEARVPVGTNVCDLTWNGKQNWVFSSLCLDLEEIGNLRETDRQTDCSSPASGERWARCSRRRARGVAAARGVEGGEGVRSGGDGRRRRKRRRGKHWQEPAGWGETRAEARCAQAAAGTSPTPGGGGARPERRANEVLGNAGTPPYPRPDTG